MKIIKNNSDEYLDFTKLSLCDGKYATIISFSGFSKGSVSVSFKVLDNVIELDETFLKDAMYDEGFKDSEVLENYVNNLTEGGEEFLIIKVDEYIPH